MGSKRIPYHSICNVAEQSMNLWTGAGRIWGMGLSPEWFPLDPQRPLKTRCIVITEIDNWVKSVVTPAAHDRVLQILREKPC